MTIIDVMAYGAIGDGIADDTVAIQSALDDVPVGGGRVVFPEGRFKVTTGLIVRHHLTVIEGMAPGNEEGATHEVPGTRLEAGGTLSGAPMLLVQDNANTEPLFGCVLRNITLDGMGLATGPGVHWRSYRSHVGRVHIYRFGTHGFRAQGYGSWDLYDSALMLVQVSECGGTGILLDTGAADMHLIHSISYDNDINLDIKASSLQATGCHFYNGRLNIRFDGNGSRSKFANCKIEGSNEHGVVLDTTNGGMSDVQFTGCNFSQNGETTSNTYDQLIVQGPSGIGCSRLHLVGNSFTQKSGPLPRYHINLGVASQGAIIVGNNLAGPDHFGTAAINDASSGSFPARIIGNTGVSDLVELKSPNNTRYRLIVSNTGTVSTVAL